MNLLLAAIHVQKGLHAFPLASFVLKAELERCTDWSIEVLDLYLSDSPKRLLDYALTQNIEAIGFSLYSWNRQWVTEAVKLLSDAAPNIILFGGGPEATADKHRILEDIEFSFLVSGEGENALDAIVSRLERPDTQQQAIVEAGLGKDLSKSCSPFLDTYVGLTQYQGILWELGRGCPFSCSFCYESKGSAALREFPLSRIKKELQLFKKAGVSYIFILDPTFNYKRQRAYELLKIFQKIAPYIHYNIEIRAEFLDSQMADQFMQINCSLQIGIQSANPSVLKEINRSIDTESFADNILLLHERGIVYGFDLIYGLPGDTYQGFLDSLDYALSLEPNHIDIFPLAVMPDTKLYDNAHAYQLQFQQQAPYTLISSCDFSVADMKNAESAARALSLFYNSGKAVPWFSLLTENLHISASDFFEQLSKWLVENEKFAKNIISMQLQFVELLCKERNFEHFLIFQDLIHFFHYSSSLDEFETRFFPEALFNLQGLLISQSFYYPVDDILDFIQGGVRDFRELVRFVKKQKHYLVFSLQEDTIIYDEISEAQHALLTHMRTKALDPKALRIYNNEFQQCLTQGLIFKTQDTDQ